MNLSSTKFVGPPEKPHHLCVCGECGSTEVSVDASCVWSFDEQRWVVDSLQDDNGYCGNCGERTGAWRVTVKGLACFTRRLPAQYRSTHTWWVTNLVEEITMTLVDLKDVNPRTGIVVDLYDKLPVLRREFTSWGWHHRIMLATIGDDHVKNE